MLPESSQPQGAVGGGNEEKALMQWEQNMATAGKAFTVPENLSGYDGVNLRRRSTEMQLVSGRNVVLNYGAAVPPFDRSSKPLTLSVEYFYRLVSKPALFLFKNLILTASEIYYTGM